MHRFTKGLIVSGAIIGVGVLLHRYTVPSEEAFIKSLPEEVRERLSAQQDEQRRRKQALMDHLAKNAASDRPAWEVLTTVDGAAKDSRQPPT
ncbi:hypothetical protein THASP1DRAFT_30394 [Thamnocephalis sphaerospora]|uniref:Cytochrome b mRNA-processing protein 4 n=1 Tax=Thamnocephalis sphaerospora TaxID=78915 RepID=A0A4P9XP79_9FUNG|nr:hypothetical protein THASP1DRAFT_30394 [Thamnocephalis sphaerospora]|eukprot:RKP07795.1 hypothetical protein THASP1DRAFT_30394 [Thamnocephalis sphaerospora]